MAQHGNLLCPPMAPTVADYARVSKAELAQLVNQQTNALQGALRDKQAIMAILCTIVKYPDAVSMDAQGRLKLDRAAIDELKENTHLTQTKQANHFIFEVNESTYILNAEPVALGMKVQALG